MSLALSTRLRSAVSRKSACRTSSSISCLPCSCFSHGLLPACDAHTRLLSLWYHPLHPRTRLPRSTPGFQGTNEPPPHTSQPPSARIPVLRQRQYVANQSLACSGSHAV